VRRSGLGRPLTLEVTPRRLVARLVAGNGRRSLVIVAAGREPRTFRLRARGGTGFPYGRIDTAEPERIVRAAGRDVRLVRLDRNGWRAEFR
jgi:hypothetical protein